MDLDHEPILAAASAGDVREVERLLGQDPSLLEARNLQGMRPLSLATWG
jgi:hypothetical protein